MSGIVPFPKPDVADVSSDPAAQPFFATPENFPISSFPPRLRLVAEELARVYQVPACLPAMCALAVTSGAVGKSVEVVGAYKDKRTRLNLYVWGVAERGAGKGNTGEPLMEPVIRRSRELSERHRRAVADQRAELGVLKREIQKLEGKIGGATGDERANLLDTLAGKQARLAVLETDATRESTLWLGDTTSESMGRALADNDETQFVYSSEAGAAVKVALGKYTKEGRGDYDLLISGYSGDKVRFGRISRKSVELLGPCLSLLWLFQDCVIRQIICDPEAMSRGLTARPLIFETGARREHDDRQILDFTRKEEWNEFVDSLLDQRLAGAEVRQIGCTPEAREVFARFHDESIDLERGPFADLQGELSRWRENAIKVAGLFALAVQAETISPALAELAVSVVRWCGFSYLGLLQVGRRERLRADLERVIELVRDNGGEINLGVLGRSHGIKRSNVEVLTATFPAHLTIERRPQPGAGRPAEVVTFPEKSTKSSKLDHPGEKEDLNDLPAEPAP